jgi:hypothetical protein
MSDLNNKFLISFTVSPETQTVAELWNSIGNLCSHIVQDNLCYSHYPLDLRERQFLGLKALTAALELTHTKMRTAIDNNEDHSDARVQGDMLEEGTPIAGTFKDLWSWLCGHFEKDARLEMDTTPITTMRGLNSGKPVKAGVSVYDIPTETFFNEDCKQQEIWTMLGRKFVENPNYVPNHRENCRQVLGIPHELMSNNDIASVVFPRDTRDVDDFDVEVRCDFKSGICHFQRK